MSECTIATDDYGTQECGRVACSSGALDTAKPWNLTKWPLEKLDCCVCSCNDVASPWHTAVHGVDWLKGWVLQMLHGLGEEVDEDPRRVWVGSI